MRTAHKIRASLIVVLTRGGYVARLVAKFRPAVPVLTVAIPMLSTDTLNWKCSGEGPARQCLVTRGLIPLLAEGSATETDTTDEIMASAVKAAKEVRRGRLASWRCCAAAPSHNCATPLDVTPLPLLAAPLSFSPLGWVLQARGLRRRGAQDRGRFRGEDHRDLRGIRGEHPLNGVGARALGGGRPADVWLRAECRVLS